MQPRVKLLIVDDHPVFRRGLREIIEEHRMFEIVGEAADGQAALGLAAEAKPDIIVLDVDMPHLNGLQTARTLRDERSAAQVVLLTMYKDEDLFNEAMDIGVKAYVLKVNAAGEIIAALQKVARGETFVSPSLSDMGRRRDDSIRELLISKPQLEDLTPAERRILKLIAEDRTSKEIADLLNISVRTVETHRLNICYKLNIHGSHGLLKFAFDHKSHL